MLGLVLKSFQCKEKSEQRKVVPYLDTSFNQPSSNTSLESSKGTSNMNSETSSHERQ